MCVWRGGGGGGMCSTFESLIEYRNTRRPCYVSKRARTATFESSELLCSLRFNGHVGANPIYDLCLVMC